MKNYLIYKFYLEKSQILCCSDLESQRVVSQEEGEKFARDRGFLFMETSAQNFQSVEEAFTITAIKINDKIMEQGVFDWDNHVRGYFLCLLQEWCQ